MVIPIFQIIITLAIAGLVLWAITQFPMDATIQRLIRVVVIFFVVLWLIYVLFGGADLGIRFR